MVVNGLRDVVAVEECTLKELIQMYEELLETMKVWKVLEKRMQSTKAEL